MGLNNVTVRSGHGSSLSDQSDAIHTLSGESFQGSSLGVCVPDLIRGVDDYRPIAFPFLYRANDHIETNANITLSDNFTVPAILHPSFSRKDITENLGNSSQFRIHWVELPEPSFNGSSIGAVVLSPPIGNVSSISSWPQNIYLCNLAAAWGTTTLQMHTSESDDIDNSVTSKATVNAEDSGSIVPYPIQPDISEIGNQFNWDYPRYPQRPINVTPGWARYLDAMVLSENRSVFDLVMQERFIIGGPDTVEAATVSMTTALVTMMSNGLARIRFESTLQGSPKLTVASDGTSWIDGNYWLSGKGNVFSINSTKREEWVKLHLISRLQGYAYNTETVPPRLAIAVLTLYCVIALAHVLYSGITGVYPIHFCCVANIFEDRLIMLAHLCRNQFNMLGLYCRNYGFGDEFIIHESITQYMRWHIRSPHLQVTCPRVCNA